MMTLHCAFLVAALLVGDSTPNAADCSAAFRAAASRIQTLDVEYTETWQQAATPSPLLQAALKWQIDENRKHLAEARNDDERMLILKSIASVGAPVTHHIRWLDAFPSVRLETRSTTRMADNSQSEQITVRSIRGGRLVSLDSNLGAAHVQSSGDTASLWIIPLHALGRRLRGSVNVSLDLLMDSPDVARVEGMETLGEIETVRLQLGPPLPEAIRPFGEDADYFGRVWLAPALDWLPIRTQWFDRDPAGDVKVTYSDAVGRTYLTNRYDLEQIESVTDEARGNTVFFPRRIRFTDAGGIRTCTMERIRINPMVEPGEFEIAIPDGFRVAIDGAVPVVRLSGGGAALNERLNGNTSAAKGLLSGRRWPALLLFNGLFVGIVVFLAFFLNRRHKHGNR